MRLPRERRLPYRPLRRDLCRLTDAWLAANPEHPQARKWRTALADLKRALKSIPTAEQNAAALAAQLTAPSEYILKGDPAAAIEAFKRAS